MVEIFRNYVDETGPKLKFPPRNFETQVTISVRIVTAIEIGGREREREGGKARAVSYKIFCVFMPVGDRVRATSLSISTLYRPIDLSDVRACRASGLAFAVFAPSE